MLGSHVVAVVCTLLWCLSQLKSYPWLLDSGATNHVTPYKHLLYDISPLPFPKFVSSPNCYRAKVVSTGALRLTSDSILHDDLIVPSFQFNLILVSQLLDQIQWSSALFTKCSCIL